MLTDVGQPVYHWYKQTQARQRLDSGADDNAVARQTYPYDGSHASQAEYSSDQRTASEARYPSSHAFITYQRPYSSYGSSHSQSHHSTSAETHAALNLHTAQNLASGGNIDQSPEDSGHNGAQMPPPIPAQLRSQLPNLIPGTPQRGWYENLDSSYRMRTQYEAHHFFKKGRVFAVLWAEAASETAARQANGGDEDDDGTIRQYNDAYTVGRFGQAVY